MPLLSLNIILESLELSAQVMLLFLITISSVMVVTELKLVPLTVKPVALIVPVILAFDANKYPLFAT